MSATVESNKSLYDCLDKVISRDNCVLCFDFSLVKQLPDILRENHGICTAADVVKNRELVKLFKLVDSSNSAKLDPRKLPELIEQSGIDLERYSTASSVEQVGHAETEFSRLTKTTQDQGSEALEAIKSMQLDLGQGKEKGKRYDPHLLNEQMLPLYFHRVCAVPATPVEKLMNSYIWGILIEAWKYQGWLDARVPTLSIGPRWLTEILYFRKIHGLTQHIGLDLFSDDPTMVTEGDMHKIPFPDNHFGFIFIKNTVNKSYDVRKLVSEMIRVTRPGGIIVTDDDTGFGFTTPLTRTDVQKASNLARVFLAQTVAQILICQDTPLKPNPGQKAVATSNARLAVRVMKSGLVSFNSSSAFYEQS
jgi:SAM-dependent methyltransferase